MARLDLILRTATKNATSTLCGEPVRDITNITPIVTGVSGAIAIIAVGIRCSQYTYLGADDVFAVLSLAAALPMGVLEFFSESALLRWKK